LKQFFIIASTRRFLSLEGFEQLFSMIWRRHTASYVLGCNITQVGVCGKASFTTFLFLSHNFRYRYARKSIKGSVVSDDSLDSKTNLIQKLTHWVGAQGQGKWHKKRKTPLPMTSTLENPKPKPKFFFQSKLEDFTNA